jgi:hypothetical protein
MGQMSGFDGFLLNLARVLSRFLINFMHFKRKNGQASRASQNTLKA